ncbi:MAG: DUF4198 domain-containing protein [Paracoccaceae bacterium]
MGIRMKIRLAFIVCLTLSSAGFAKAHEFWVSPDEYLITAEDQIQARLRVGVQMKGAVLSYLPNDISRFEVIERDVVRPVTGRMGDNPALAMEPLGDGLVIVVHETRDTRLAYKDFNVFANFVTHKDAAWALDAHATRGLPQTDFAESYRRHAKSLIAVGDGAGSDRVVGMKIELVAEANPYTDDLSDGLPLRVLLDGAPRANAQVELFATHPDGEVSVSLHRTDSAGRVVVPVERGVEYLADSVALTALENDDVNVGPVWHSDWASLTFQVPE